MAAACAASPQAPSFRRRLRDHRATRGPLGQSLAEFALILPVLLAFLGLTIDFARIFQAWITLESATRDAAELVATSATDADQAAILGRRTVCLQSRAVPGFAPGGSPAPADVEQCASPAVAVVSFARSDAAPGGAEGYPVGTATVQSQLVFRTLFAYPFITRDGSWTITTRASYSVVQGRQ